MMRRFLADTLHAVADLMQPSRRGDVDGLQLVYDDTVKLLDRIYAGKSRSRRNRPRGMSERRWRAAYQLLRDTDVLDKRGEVWSAMAPDFETAEWRVRTELERRRERAASRTYVARK